MAEGRSSVGGLVVAFLAPGAGRVGFVAGRRIGGAVARNRARRVMRAAWREVEPAAERGYDVVWVARGSIRRAKTQDLVAEMTELLGRPRGGRV